MKETSVWGKSKGSIFLSAVGAVIILAMTSWALAAEGDVYKGRLSYHWGPKHYSAIMASKFAEECKKATNGRLDIEVFPSGQLYSIAQIVPALSQGSVDIGGVLGVLFMRVDKNFFLSGMMRFFDSFQQKRDFWERNPVGKKYWDALQKKLGIKILAYIPVGPTCYFTTARPLDSMEAFKGLKARTLIGTERYSFEPLNINFVKVSTAEVYTALKSGMIDTLQTVPSAITAYSWWDFLKYAQQPYNFYADAYVAANVRWWDSLPQDIQDIVLNDVGPRISKEATNGVTAYSNDTLKEFVEKHGGTISTLPPAELKRLIEIERNQVWPKIAENIDPGLYEAAMKFAGHK
ncbi:MAG: TRAP transporter substrate-binding protein [Desulfobacteraceae bacterium]|jgi:TRAP-type C4-dicarboxylate transport system substrate-binding protein